ncbi:hypothetical protein BSKO_12341 [Bryopsis sp. KO-2023]|nr:hypothetical protein BSKO_12341 [Bryopsis sp. KO-2023]
MRATAAAVGIGLVLCLLASHVHAAPPNRALLELLGAEPLNGDQGPWRVSPEALKSPMRGLLAKKHPVDICNICIYSCCLDEYSWFYCCSKEEA